MLITNAVVIIFALLSIVYLYKDYKSGNLSKKTFTIMCAIEAVAIICFAFLLI